MSVSELLMKPGSWTVKLREETPAEILRAIDWTVTPTAGFGHVFIFNAPVRPDEYSDTALKSIAIYGGILREAPDARSIGGPGMIAWLGDEDDKGDILETPASENANLATWIAALIPAALTTGTVTSPAGTYRGTFQWITRRKALDAVSAALVTEYRVNPSGALDAGTAAVLFGTTPTGFVTRRTESREDYLGILASQLEQARDLQDYTTRARALTKVGIGTADAAATPYKDINGNAVVMTRIIEVPESEDSDAASDALIVKFATTRRAVRLSSSTFAIPSTIEVGASVYVFDPRSGLIDTANQVYFAGETLFPVALRVYGYTWPICEGMGVAFRDGNGTWTDLTPWVAWDSGDTTIDVGGYVRTLDGDPSYSSSAGISTAVKEGGWTDFLPTVTQSGSVTYNVLTKCNYKRDPGRCEAHGSLTVTGSGTGGNVVSFGIPIIAAVTNVADTIGFGFIYDSSAAIKYRGLVVMNSSTTARFLTLHSTADGYLGTTDFTAGLAAGDVISFHYSYETLLT